MLIRCGRRPTTDGHPIPSRVTSSRVTTSHISSPLTPPPRASRIRANLHLVLAMSPIGDVFRDRLRMFPSLVNCCTIDWFSEWPPEALVSVAAQTLDAVEVSADGVREKLVQVITLSSHLTVAL